MAETYFICQATLVSQQALHRYVVEMLCVRDIHCTALLRLQGVSHSRQGASAISILMTLFREAYSTQLKRKGFPLRQSLILSNGSREGVCVCVIALGHFIFRYRTQPGRARD